MNLNSTATCSPNAERCVEIRYIETFEAGSDCDRAGASDMSTVLNRRYQREVEECLTVSELGLVCFGCSSPATFVALGQPFCCKSCAREVGGSTDRAQLRRLAK